MRVANKAQAELYAAILRDGGTHKIVERMQTRAELYAAIGLHDLRSFRFFDREVDGSPSLQIIGDVEVLRVPLDPELRGKPVRFPSVQD